MLSTKSFIKTILQLDSVVIEGTQEGVDKEGFQCLVVNLRPHARMLNRCPHCNAKCPRSDGDAPKPHRWRARDWGRSRVYLEYANPRIVCPTHGEVMAAVPWASDPESNFTSAFEKHAAQFPEVMKLM